MFSLIHPTNQNNFEYTKGVIRSRKSKKDRQYNTQIKRTKGQQLSIKQNYIKEQ